MGDSKCQEGQTYGTDVRISTSGGVKLRKRGEKCEEHDRAVIISQLLPDQPEG
jgi:hypothetical protein